MKNLSEATERYDALIDQLAQDTSRNLGAIGDAAMEGVRFYTFDSLSGYYKYDEATELRADVVDDIESFLLKATGDYSLLAHMLAKLSCVAPAFNANGKTVFLGSWGMSAGEIGWMIRRINDRAAFDRYLCDAKIDEDEVDAFNEAFQLDVTEAEQGVRGNRR